MPPQRTHHHLLSSGQRDIKYLGRPVEDYHCYLMALVAQPFEPFLDLQRPRWGHHAGWLLVGFGVGRQVVFLSPVHQPVPDAGVHERSELTPHRVVLVGGHREQVAGLAEDLCLRPPAPFSTPVGQLVEEGRELDELVVDLLVGYDVVSFWLGVVCARDCGCRFVIQIVIAIVYKIPCLHFLQRLQQCRRDT